MTVDSPSSPDARNTYPTKAPTLNPEHIFRFLPEGFNSVSTMRFEGINGNRKDCSALAVSMIHLVASYFIRGAPRPYGPRVIEARLDIGGGKKHFTPVPEPSSRYPARATCIRSGICGNPRFYSVWRTSASAFALKRLFLQ